MGEQRPVEHRESAVIKGLSIANVWVLDHERAKAFCTEQLGLEIRTDMTMGEAGMRWLTVGAKDSRILRSH